MRLTSVVLPPPFPFLQVVLIQPVDSGNKAHHFGHAVVAGIERYPSKITRRMSKSRQDKRSKIKPFIKVINYNHLMPTRYTLELEGLKGIVSGDTFKEVSQREDAKKNVKKVLEERYTSGKNRWFFTPLSTLRVLALLPRGSKPGLARYANICRQNFKTRIKVVTPSWAGSWAGCTGLWNIT